MIELDDIWSQMLAETGKDPRLEDRVLLADFIALKSINDEIRQRAVDWLVGIFIELAGQANRRNIPIEIDRNEPHRFDAYGANMVGTKVDFRYGVRCVSVEAGWTRGPKDGFMRGGALAVAQIRHFGITRHGADLALLKTSDLPEWHEIDRDNVARPVQARDLARHLAILIDHNA